MGAELTHIAATEPELQPAKIEEPASPAITAVVEKKKIHPALLSGLVCFAVNRFHSEER